MDKKTSSGRRSRRKHLRRRIIAWTGLLLVATATVVGAFIFNRMLNAPVPPLYVPIDYAIVPPEYQIPLARYERKVYPYSVIEGGVRSREELSASIRSDQLVAAHFVDFHVDDAQIVTASKDQFAYVSYRLKNRIYWTKKKVFIAKGETLITDGKCVARGRCGNRVSATPMAPTSNTEPALETFDIPQLAKLELPQLEPLIEPGLPPLAPIPVPGLPAIAAGGTPIVPWALRPIDVPGGYTPSHTGPGGKKPSPVPEPGTMLLVFTGLAAAAVIGIRRRKP